MFVKNMMNQSNSLLEIERGGKKYHRTMIDEESVFKHLWISSYRGAGMKDTIIEWCDKNLDGNWTYCWYTPDELFWPDVENDAIAQLMLFFEHKSDAVAFRLRWT